MIKQELSVPVRLCWSGTGSSSDHDIRMLRLSGMAQKLY